MSEFFNIENINEIKSLEGIEERLKSCLEQNKDTIVDIAAKRIAAENDGLSTLQANYFVLVDWLNYPIRFIAGYYGRVPQTISNQLSIIRKFYRLKRTMLKDLLTKEEIIRLEKRNVPVIARVRYNTLVSEARKKGERKEDE